MLVKELDHDRLWYGPVTRDAEGQLKVYDPVAVGDAAARQAWHASIG